MKRITRWVMLCGLTVLLGTAGCGSDDDGTVLVCDCLVTCNDNVAIPACFECVMDANDCADFGPLSNVCAQHGGVSLTQLSNCNEID